jgi:hypothetical protein
MFSPAQTLGQWVRTPLEAWMCVCVSVRVVLWGAGDPPPMESYRKPPSFMISELILNGNRPDSLIRQDRRRRSKIKHMEPYDLPQYWQYLLRNSTINSNCTPRRPGFNSRSVHVGCVLDNVVLYYLPNAVSPNALTSLVYHHGLVKKKIHWLLVTEETPGSVVGWGTILHAGRPRVQFPMSQDFSIDLILPAALGPWVRHSL